jgi:hypothetical protein
LFIIGLNRLKPTPWTPHSDSSNLVVESPNLSGGARIAKGQSPRIEFLKQESVSFAHAAPHRYAAGSTLRFDRTDPMRSRENIQMLQMLLARLERVSVDSYWAHRASGVRGSLLRALELLEAGEGVSPAGMQSTVEQAFRILERAARERVR